METRKKILPVDELVAQRLRAARLAKGMSQTAAANHLGLTFQQVQKYEHAVNRLSLGRLAVLAQLYDKPLAWFFDGAEVGSGVPARDLGAELFSLPYGADLARAYIAIAHNVDRRALVGVAEAVARAGQAHQVSAE